MEKSILELSEKIKQQETAIFCGAGISFNSGLPLAADLILYVLDVMKVSNSDAIKILSSNLPFEWFIQTLKDEENVDRILDIFSKGEPNTNHKFIAGLIQKGFVKTILTTNFDTLVEKALIDLGLIDNVDFQVYSTETQFGNIDWENGTVKIIKIHGCITNKSEMAITLELVAKGTNIQNKNNVISSFFSKSINPNVLILGYSCSDIFDISPQIKALETDRSQISFVEHVIPDSEFIIEDITDKKIKNPFVKYDGHRLYMSVDVFIKNLWNLLIDDNYDYIKSKINWQENIDIWLKDASEYSEGIKNHISARIMYDIGEFETAIRIWEEGLMIAQNECNQIFFYSQLGNIGMALNAIGKYTEALKCLENSVDNCKKIGNMQGAVSQLQALGNIYRNLGEFDNAIRVFNEAVLASRNLEPDSLCSTLGNLATVYNHINDYEKAIEILDQGYAIAISTGNKQSEGSMLTSYGIAYFQKGEYDKAVEFVKKSILVTKQIGDRQGECMALHNLSNFSLQFNDFELSIACSNSSLIIAKELGIRQSEGAAYYNIGSCYFFKGEQALAIYNLQQAVDIYRDICGDNHSHTESAINALDRATNYPDSNNIL